jgi:hypothetical protein
MVTLDTVETVHGTPRQKKAQEYMDRLKETLFHPEHKNDADTTATVVAEKTDLTTVNSIDADFKWKDERSKPNTEPLYVIPY